MSLAMSFDDIRRNAIRNLTTLHVIEFVMTCDVIRWEDVIAGNRVRDEV